MAALRSAWPEPVAEAALRPPSPPPVPVAPRGRRRRPAGGRRRRERPDAASLQRVRAAGHQHQAPGAADPPGLQGAGRERHARRGDPALHPDRIHGHHRRHPEGREQPGHPRLGDRGLHLQRPRLVEVGSNHGFQKKLKVLGEGLLEVKASWTGSTPTPWSSRSASAPASGRSGADRSAGRGSMEPGHGARVRDYRYVSILAFVRRELRKDCWARWRFCWTIAQALLDLREGQLARGDPLRDLDDVKAEGRLHDAGDLPRLEAEGGLLEGRDHLPRPNPEVAAVLRAAGVLGGLPGQRGEVLLPRTRSRRASAFFRGCSLPAPAAPWGCAPGCGWPSPAPRSRRAAGLDRRRPGPPGR